MTDSMTGYWNFGAKIIIFSTAGFALSLFVSFFFIKYSWLAPTLMSAMLLSASATLPFAVAYVVWLRWQRRKIVARKPLTHDEFVALAPKLRSVDPCLIQDIRSRAAKHFRCFGGAKFYPEDRLAEDLHLEDVGFLPDDEFFDEMLELAISYGVPADAEIGPVTTFGELIIAIDNAIPHSSRRKKWN